jgi:hypothetical protein
MAAAGSMLQVVQQQHGQEAANQRQASHSLRQAPLLVPMPVLLMPVLVPMLVVGML